MLALYLALFRAIIGAEKDLKQTNLLFIMFDDLRPELSNYGRSHMITPNFERLAEKSVTFDYAFTHIAVCNPARDAIMTGLRPDSVGTYNFGHSFRPHMPFPTQLIHSGYNTAAFGKVFHYEGSDTKIWNYESWENGWYEYQRIEDKWMNSSTMPDKVQPIEKYRDYEFTTRAIDCLRKMSQKETKYFMLAIGYKLPHLAVHVPYKFYDMYKGKNDAWKLTKKELRFPITTSEVSYRCCASKEFRYMNAEGALPSNRSVPIGNINNAFTSEMHDELMIGYAAAVSFVDKQIGRLFDVMDELNLWENTTVVLSSDHGMHNGEKGIWEKWTLFEEAVRVPLMIAHPLSPNKRTHYKYPVESVDIYATIDEILALPVSRHSVCDNNKGLKCKPLQGKSLSPVILGPELWERNFGQSVSLSGVGNNSAAHISSSGINNNKTFPTVNDDNKHIVNVVMNQKVAISQSNRCAYLVDISENPVHHRQPLILSNKRSVSATSAAATTTADNVDNVAGTTAAAAAAAADNAAAAAAADNAAAGAVGGGGGNGLSGVKAQHKIERKGLWKDCDLNLKFAPSNEVALMGYSMRTPEYRYTAYFRMIRLQPGEIRPDLIGRPYEEELYDHKNETLADFTHRETVNLAYRPSYSTVVTSLRTKLVTFIQENMVFGDH